jgi:hypothetical protein
LRRQSEQVRWQRLRGRRTDPVEDVAIAKARRALRGNGQGRSYTTGQDGTPQGQYTADEVQALGEAGKALKKVNGPGFWFPIVVYRDINNAVIAYRELTPRQREGSGVYAWIIKRAVLLKATHLLPRGWAEPVQKAPVSS